MAFDSKRFMKEKFEPRTESVPLPSLASWFGDGDEPVWVIRGLEGAEFARTQEAGAKAVAAGDLAKALAAAAGSKEKVEAIMVAAGLPADMKKQPKDLVIRLEMLAIASVQPAIDLQVAIKLAQAFPIEFFDLTNRIINLTGQGMQPGKSKPSGNEAT